MGSPIAIVGMWVSFAVEAPADGGPEARDVCRPGARHETAVDHRVLIPRHLSDRMYTELTSYLGGKVRLARPTRREPMYPALFATFTVMAFDSGAVQATDRFRQAVADSETVVDRTERYGVGHRPVVGPVGAVRV